ncbi:uncharacterized protein ColSpa_06912 [Colletotrichum spaethianum]|uniref:Uncharacterized protein n=1 Tax=Colletotrichum spaethianum TaxID=700344 RepID=A0AA37P6L5_9PEZI|nr:uncharacterized protein ColSpa_06912 [Colletotrichum spaethianum]GKT46731.1 hypothetical protein ColSpa_06912 [Colletotrichum spaethianum]
MARIASPPNTPPIIVPVCGCVESLLIVLGVGAGVAVEVASQVGVDGAGTLGVSGGMKVIGTAEAAAAVDVSENWVPDGIGLAASKECLLTQGTVVPNESLTFPVQASGPVTG